MSARPSSNVIPMPPARIAAPAERRARTTVLHAVADDEGLVEAASVVAALDRRSCFRQLVVHAGAAEPGFAEGAELGGIHRRLGVGAGTHAERTAATLTAFEALLLEERPDVVIVAGEDDAALAAALAAAKLQIAVAHLNSGLRCWDWTQPEEVNRVVIDRLSDTLFTSSAEAGTNLCDEGVPEGRIHPVGNTRIDTLRRYEAHARARAVWAAHGAGEREYTLVALQRRESLEPIEHLARIAAALEELAATGPVLLLAHTRTRAALEGEEASALVSAADVRRVGPLGYLASLSLHAGAGAILTDASAVQEEASALGVPCYTLLPTTARTVTLTHGTNVLLGDDVAEIACVRPTRWAPTPAAIPLWDGRAGERVADALVANYTLAAAYAEDR